MFAASVEHMRERAQEADIEAVALGLEARSAVAALPEGTERAALETNITASHADAQKKLRHALAAATMALALNATPTPEKGISPERASAAAQALAENPELAQELLQNVLHAAEARPEIPDSFVRETNSVLERLQQPDENRYGKLSLKVGEIAARTLMSASGLGIVVGGYDILKEIVKTTRASRV